MTREEAISILTSLQEPEAWEPQVTERVFTALQMAITAIKGQKVLADVLGGCPLPQPCDKMWRSKRCAEHCENNKLVAPDAECWLRYAEVMANDTGRSDSTCRRSCGKE